MKEENQQNRSREFRKEEQITRKELDSWMQTMRSTGTREVEKGAHPLAANRKGSKSYETEKIFEKQLANHAITALRIWGKRNLPMNMTAQNMTNRA